MAIKKSDLYSSLWASCNHQLPPKLSEQRNFVRLGSKPVLQKPAISRLGTKSEKVMRF